MACLAIVRQALGTQVYETPSDSSQQQWQPWGNQDSVQASSQQQEEYHPVTFEASDTQESQRSPVYNANVQSGASGVAEVLNQQSVRIISSLLYKISSKQFYRRD